MTKELSPLELARDEVSNAVGRWITATTEGGEESATAEFDAALAAFEQAVIADFLYSRFRLTPEQLRRSAEAEEIDFGSAL